MKMKIVLALTLLAAATAASVSLAGTDGQRTLVFASHDEAGNFVLDDLGAKSTNGPDIGDLLAFTQTLTVNGRTAGVLHLAAVGVDHRRRLTQAEGTVVLTGGTIEVAGLVPQTPHFTLAITGGTGTYLDSRGTLAVTTPKHTSRITITLE
jgi:hypothetical protein